jgi:hypothetical protein
VKALMIALMTWASPHVELPVPERVPNVAKLDRCDLQAVIWPRVECSQTHGPVAGYRDGTVFLMAEFSVDDLYHVSALLHELVHHMQFEADVAPVPCAQEAFERPAYEAQIAFLEAAGVDAMEVMGINGLALLSATSCLWRE